MTADVPLISVVVAARNAEPYLAELLESVLAQDVPTDLIVVDDGSTDGTRAVAESCGAVRVFSQPQQGVAAARNRGLQEVRGELVALADADDILVSGRLRAQAELLREPTIAGVIGMVENFVHPGLSDPAWIHNDMTEPRIGLATLMTRRTVLEAVGGFDPRLKVSEEFEWITRARDAGFLIAVLDRLLLRRRLHTTNLSQNLDIMRRNRMAILRASIGRKRMAVR